MRSLVKSLLRLAAALTGAAAIVAAMPSEAAHRAGPPWISIEYPANPLDPSTRGGYLLVHSFHHQQVVAADVSGEVVTWDHGTRRANPLRFESTSRPGAYRLTKQWSDGTPYVLLITV